MLSDEETTPATPTKNPLSAESSNAKSRPMISLSDSDSDIDLDNDNSNNSYLAGLNVPDRLKNILRYKDIASTQDNKDDNSDSDDDDGDLFMRPLAPKTPRAPTGSVSTPTITASTTTRLTPIDPSALAVNQQNRFQQLLARAMASDSSSDDDDTTSKGKKKKTTTKPKPKKSLTAKKAATTTKSKEKKTKKKGSTTETTKKKKKSKTAKDDDDDSDNDNQRGALDDDSSSSSDSDSDSGFIGTKKRKKSTALALLQNSDDSDSDESTSKPRKQLSRKAKLEMQRETQRLRRDAHVKIQPRIIRKTLDSFLERLDNEDMDDTPSRSGVSLDDEEDDDIGERQQQSMKTEQSASRINIYNKYQKELQKLDEFNKNHLDDEDDGLIIVRTESRSTKFMKALVSAVSPEQTSRAHRTDIFNHSKGKTSSPIALRTLNQQLMARMTQEQQARRQEMEDKAKAMGVYLSAEERAIKHLEREQEAAVIDLEVQQLLHKKALQKQQMGSSKDNDDNDDYEEEGNDGDDGLVFSGEDDNDDSDGDGNSEVDDSATDDDGHVVLSRRARSTMKQKNPFLDDDEDERSIKKKGPKTPEPAHSIANFFTGKSNKKNTDAIVDDATDEPKKLSRLMQRTTIEDEEMEPQDHDNSDHALDEHNNESMDDTAIEPSTSPIITQTSVPKKPKERNDYVEEEAEEEEDEFFGLGGPDIAETADLDQFEEDGMLVQDNNNHEKVDSSELQAEYHKNMIESDKHMVERLIKDITSGGLRRKRAAAAAGLLLDDYDLYDDDEAEDLVALRLASANKRKKFMKGDDIMNFLASDPKTAAFAKAAMPNPGEFDLSGDELEEGDDGGNDDKATDNNNNKDNSDDDNDDNDDGNGNGDSDNGDDDIDDLLDLGDGHSDTVATVDGTTGLYDIDDNDASDEEIKVNIDMVVGDYVQPWARHSNPVDGSPARG